jgi:hypothetical protein
MWAIQQHWWHKFVRLICQNTQEQSQGLIDSGLATVQQKDLQIRTHCHGGAQPQLLVL